MQVTLVLWTTDFPIEIRLQITFVSLLRYVITILADLVRSEPTYTSSNWRVESTLSDSDTNIASNSLTSSSNVGLCIGDSCQHFNIIWYLRKQEKPKTHTICFPQLLDVFLLGSFISRATSGSAPVSKDYFLLLLDCLQPSIFVLQYFFY